MIELGSKARKLPAPPAIVWESLMNPLMPAARPWLNLLDDEVEPTILDAEKPIRVVWSSLWPTRPNDQVHLTLTTAGSETLLRFTLLTPDDLPNASQVGHLRRRINHLLFADPASPTASDTSPSTPAHQRSVMRLRVTRPCGLPP